MKQGKIYYLLFLFLLVGLPIFFATGPFQDSFLKGLMIVMASLTVLWLISLLIKDASIIDIFWGLGFVIVVWFFAWDEGFAHLDVRRWIFIGLVSIWGLRLTIYLAFRNLGNGEDYRYQEWRKQYGKNWWWISLFRVFVLQGVILASLSTLFIPILRYEGAVDIYAIIGLIIWDIGFFFEAVGDYQLRTFKSDPANKGKVLNNGLWRYTRHPNYFGDSVMWWGLFCFVLPISNALFLIICPLFMTFMLLKISGAAMLERKLQTSKPAYAEYIRKTSTFFPLPPKQ